MMARGFSIYLDLLRVIAALVVVLSHLAYTRFTEGRWFWVRELNLGSDAVVVFFVLSGLVIAFCAERRDTGFGPYLFNRATRLLSVALPALLLGFVLDRWGVRIAPALYDGFYQPLPLWEMLLRGLTFSNEFAFQPVRLGSNGPFWSLSYEAAYYVLFGVAFYLTGARRVLLLLLGALVAGLNILLLMPAWLMGVAVWRALAAGRLPGRGAAWALALIPVAAYAGALAIGAPGWIEAHLQPPLAGLRFSDEYLWNGLLGLLVALHLWGVAGLARAGSARRWHGSVRWVAGAGFSIYLVHYPVLQALKAAWPGLGTSLAGDLVLLGLTLAACLLFAQLFERPLPRFRSALLALLPARRAAPAAPVA
jgi:peptidoglycan/LPS O-acetylase OafA/YrhL